MKLPQESISILLNAEAKALATVWNDDINVIPVSSVKVVENEIWLINYFFGKTLTNIKQNPNVAFTFWKGLKGYQVKAKTNYLTEGEKFKKAVDWISKIHPNRIVKGLLVLNTIAVFDISIDNKRI
jgi:uncharacterized pyridoxamine 5'-phosphate oxidase family protein